jgi:hypothetical protein
MRARLRFALVGLLAGLACNATVALAWTGPTASAPGSNIAAPINVGDTMQAKNGDLGVNNLTAFGNVLLSGLGVGTGRYLNFDYTSGGTSGTGSSGYGMRDNAGTLEFKNRGGSWASLQSTIATLAGSQWTNGTSGSIYYNVGNVGIGTATPGAKLDVVGTVRGTTFCIGASCLSSWPSTGVGGSGTASYLPRFANATTLSNSSIFDNGNVGIGTAAPSTKLDVSGAIKGTSFCIGASCIVAWPSGLGGSGTTNYLAKYSSATSLGNSSIFDNGNVGIGTAAPGAKLDVAGTVRANAFLYSSDARLKANIEPIDGALWKVRQLTGVSFDWNALSARSGKHDIGVIAQDVQEVAPEAVVEDPETGLLAVDYARLVPLLVNAIKERQAESDAQRHEINELREALRTLEP